MQVVEKEVGYFPAIAYLEDNGLKTFLLSNGTTLVIPDNVVFIEMKRGSGKLPTWPKSTLDMIIKGLRASNESAS